MEFISSTGTCQVPVPVLALPRWSSFPVRALGKCLYQYWHGYLLPKLLILLYCGKIAIRKRTLVSLSLGTSTGIALLRTGIGNLHVWVPTCTSSMGWLRVRSSCRRCSLSQSSRHMATTRSHRRSGRDTNKSTVSSGISLHVRIH